MKESMTEDEIIDNNSSEVEEMNKSCNNNNNSSNNNGLNTVDRKITEEIKVENNKNSKNNSIEKEELIVNKNINIPKIKKKKIVNNRSYPTQQSIYENFDLQKMAYSIIKDYSHLHINKNEEFMERMKFDIYKRQIKDEKINHLIEKSKLKSNETERIKTFNHLIEDANRRIEAQDYIDSLNLKEEPKNTNTKQGKYKTKDWDKIYNERFIKFQEIKNKKNLEKLKKKREVEALEEENQMKMCTTKKAPRKEIERSIKRLYEHGLRKYIKSNTCPKDEEPNFKEIEDNIEQYIKDQEEIRRMPHPQHPSETNSNNNIEDENKFDYEQLAKNKLNSSNIYLKNTNNIYLKELHRGHSTFVTENEANKIVDLFFTKNLKKLN